MRNQIRPEPAEASGVPRRRVPSVGRRPPARDPPGKGPSNAGLATRICSRWSGSRCSCTRYGASARAESAAQEIYLATDGNEFVLRLTWPASLIVALVVLVVGYVSTSMTVRVAALGMSLIWYLSLLSVGTRMSCTFPLILGVLVLYRALAPARYGLSRIRPGGVLGAALLLVLAVASFGVILTARVNPHGLLNLTSLFTEVAQSGTG